MWTLKFWNMYICMFMCVLIWYIHIWYIYHIYVCISMLFHWNKDTPVTMSTSDIQILLSIAVFSLQELAFLREMTVSRAEAGKVQDESGTFFFLKLKWNSHSIKWTILKCTLLWYLVHPQACVTTTSIQWEPGTSYASM